MQYQTPHHFHQPVLDHRDSARPTRAFQSYQQGFTLLELLVGVAILGIVLALAIPGYRQVTASNQLYSAANELLMSFKLARSEATRRSGRVTWCRGDNTGCDNNSLDGWIIFQDLDRDSNLDAGEDVLQVYGALPPIVNLVGDSSPLQFRSNGSINGSPRTLLICDANNAAPRRRAVDIALSGKASILTSDEITINCP